MLWAAICYYDEPPTIAGTLDILTETPTASAQSPNADVLCRTCSHVVRLSGSIFWKAEFGAPFAVVSYGQPPMPPGKRATRQHGTTIFHLIAEGGCWLEVPGRPRIELGQGDVMLLPSAGSAFGGGEARSRFRPTILPMPYLKEGVVTTMRHGIWRPAPRSSAAMSRSGRPVLQPDLPRNAGLLVERTEGEPVTSLLASTVRALLAEVEVLRPGSRDMLGRMMEMLFVEMLRRYVAQLPPGHRRLVRRAGRSDRQPRLAGDPCRTDPRLDGGGTGELCRRLARVLADRFKAILGQPPMQYLAVWRLQLCNRHAARRGLLDRQDSACRRL